MTQVKSSYVKKLEELGFQRVEGTNLQSHIDDFLTYIEAIHGKLTRGARRKLVRHASKEATKPSFTVTKFKDGSLLTEATDDSGQMWKIEDSVDLKPFGFLNHAEWLRSLTPTLH